MDNKIINKNRLIRRRRIFLIRRIILLFLIFVIFLLVLINSPLFNIKYINIVGNKLLSADYVKQELNILYNKNILFYSIEQNLSVLRQNKYVDGVMYKKIFPNKLDIIIEEKKVDYYIPYNNSFYILDSNLRLVDVRDYIEDLDIMEIKGIDFSGNLNIGDQLLKDGSRELDWIRSISDLLELNKTNVKFDYVDLTDIHNVIIGYKNIIIKIGKNSDLRQKFNIVINTINSNEGYSKMTGYIDVRTKNHPIISIQ
ncbi:cell division protein FtsQ/DivIB [Candidatus Arthromitus sp. SFB-rat-Yit]|uniref:cell division protein FtsQ/DivIB n=1 Tax=Candidatus Arthromitus sp. SFB-rat-Yit TaxID=1041504 RepID=UPI000227A0FB|nr:FtsQ-type POTRA domain-containing protein [Candidatus Arthromitus sp. SFB-rat-Yit]BAK81317.1 putative cell division protein FtsQ [Candidatus Arthromitus sp. SFB-rat-Yit]